MCEVRWKPQTCCLIVARPQNISTVEKMDPIRLKVKHHFSC